MESSITEEMQFTENLKIDITAFPAWKLFESRADRVSIKADYLTYDNLVLEDITAFYEQVMLSEEQIYGYNTDLKLIIGQDGLNQFVQQQYPDLESIQISLQQDEILIEGTILLLGMEVDVLLVGGVDVVNNQVLFIPEEVKVQELPLPRNLVEGFLAEQDLAFNFELDQLFFPLEIDKILIESEQILILGGQFAEKAGQ